MNIRPCDLLDLLNGDMHSVNFEFILKDAQRASALLSKKVAEIRHVIALDIADKMDLTDNESTMLYALEDEYVKELSLLGSIIDFAYRSKGKDKEKRIPRSPAVLIALSKQVE